MRESEGCNSREAATDATPNGVVRNAVVFAPLNQSLANATDFDCEIPSEVPALLLGSRNPNVARPIVSVLVGESVDAQAARDAVGSRRQKGHDVGCERREVVPLGTDLNPTATIIVIGVVVWILASVVHSGPSSVQGMSRPSVGGVAVLGIGSGDFFSAAAARSTVGPAEKAIGRDGRFSPAITPARNTDALAFRSLNPSDAGHNQASESFANQFRGSGFGRGCLKGRNAAVFHGDILPICIAQKNPGCDTTEQP